MRRFFPFAALLGVAFVLGCQDVGTGVVASDGPGPQFAKPVCPGPHPSCGGDEDDGDNPGSPFYVYTFISNVIATDPSPANGFPSGDRVFLSATQNTGPSIGDEALHLSKKLFLDTPREAADCFNGDTFITQFWSGRVQPVKPHGNEVIANFLFHAEDKNDKPIGYRLRLQGIAVTDGNAGDGIFPPEPGETMTVPFSTFFIEPGRNKEKNACTGAGDLSQLEVSTTITILGVAEDPA